MAIYGKIQKFFPHSGKTLVISTWKLNFSLVLGAKASGEERKPY
jgi:hypothetical protein